MGDTGLTPKAKVDGRHELVERLDDRGAGEVWKARDPDFKTRLAMLKVLAPVAGASAVPPALGELAKRLRAVKHPSLLTVLSVGMAGERPYLSLAWFEGPSLAASLHVAEEAGEPVPIDALARVFDLLCGAAEACHHAGFVHGGITPGCVLVQRGAGEVEVRLADVGLAAWADQGTAHLYADCVAPEAKDPRTVTAAADVFALGATLRRALAAAKGAEAWVEPSGKFRGRDDAPAAVWQVVARATRAAANERFESVAELRAALAEAWRDDARLPVRRSEVVPAQNAAPSPELQQPPSLWEVPSGPPAPRPLAPEEQRTTFKLPSLAGVPAGPPASSPLSLDSLLGQEPAAHAESSPPARRESAPVPTGAQNPWSTDVLRREAHVTPPVPTGAQNPWSTDVLRREVHVEAPAGRTDIDATHVDARPGAPVAVEAPAAAPLTLDGLVGGTTAASGTLAWGAAPEAPEPKVPRTEMASPAQLEAALAQAKARVPSAERPAPPPSRSRSRVWIAVAVALVLLAGAVVATLVAGVS